MLANQFEVEIIKEQRDMLLDVCKAIFKEVGNGGDLDYHLRVDGYAAMLESVINKVAAQQNAGIADQAMPASKKETSDDLPKHKFVKL